MSIVCCTVPADAVTAKVDVVAFCEVPHPVNIAPRPIATVSRTATALRLRGAAHPKQQPASRRPLVQGRPPLRRLTAVKPEATVIVVVAAPPCGVTVAGEKLQVTSAGKPEHAKEICSAKPSCGVTVRAMVPLWPRTSVREAEVPELAVKVKGDELTVSVSTAEVLAALLLSPG